MATSPLSEIANAPFVAAYLGAGLPVFAVAAVLGRLIFKVRPSEAALQGSAAVLGNTGYMGLPLVAAAFGDRAAIPLVLGLTLEVTVLIPLTIILVEAQKGFDAGWSELLRSRSEEHTSELQSRQYLVCRLLLEKKKDIILI